MVSSLILALFHLNIFISYNKSQPNIGSTHPISGVLDLSSLEMSGSLSLVFGKCPGSTVSSGHPFTFQTNISMLKSETRLLPRFPSKLDRAANHCTFYSQNASICASNRLACKLNILFSNLVFYRLFHRLIKKLDKYLFFIKEQF